MKSHYGESLLKSSKDLEIFFNSNHVTLHSTQQYFKERGIFAFTSRTDYMAKFASMFVIGVDSQEEIKKIIDVKSFPYISGFILKANEDTSLEELQNYLRQHSNEEFEVKSSSLINIIDEDDLFIGIFDYLNSDLNNIDLFQIVRRKQEFEVIKFEDSNDSFLVSIILKNPSDYFVLYGIINTIINRDHGIELNIIEHDLSKLELTKRIHEFFLELISNFGAKYEFLGPVKFYRSKAKDNHSTDDFEDSLLDGSQELKLTNIKRILTGLENRGAYLRGIELVLHDPLHDYIFIIKIIAEIDKKRIEIGFVGDVKQITSPEQIEKIVKKSDISKLESASVSNDEKQKILKNIWYIVSNQYYKFRNTNVLIQDLDFKQEDKLEKTTVVNPEA